MFISQTHAQEVDAPTYSEVGATMPADSDPAFNTGGAFINNIAFIAFIVIAFYLLLIRPQQKRFKEHADMLEGLKKGDRVVTAGGIIGKIEKIAEGDNEVVLNLGGAVKVTVLRSMIQSTKNDSDGK